MGEVGGQLIIASSSQGVERQGQLRGYFPEQQLLVVESWGDKCELRFENVAKLDSVRVLRGPRDLADQLVALLPTGLVRDRSPAQRQDSGRYRRRNSQSSQSASRNQSRTDSQNGSRSRSPRKRGKKLEKKII